MLEAAYSCFVEDLNWRSSSLSFNDKSDSGPWTKVNVYSVPSLSGNAAGVMHSDFTTGMSYLEVVSTYLSVPGVTVHEYGHGLTYHARTWVDQSRTGAWWETVAEWFADTYQTSPLCASARTKHSQPTSPTPTGANLQKIIGSAHAVLVDGSADTGNYYEAWPFLSYLTYNPDNTTGLGADTIRQSFIQYSAGSNETPLHTFARLANGTAIQDVVGRYWARMAFADIGHPSLQSVFDDQKGSIDFDNLDVQADGSYKVKDARKPRYMGANIIPLKTSSSAGPVSASIKSTGKFTATLSIRNAGAGTTRYVDFADGTAKAELSEGEEAAVVVANTPELVLYDPFSLTEEVTKGLEYSLSLTGATA
ncbi:hypothetical protein BU24DRAFT_390728 [Aaosphaeria arxii CBS 175.79]|uniref:Uncharacterized protein n=1 Tax=Aaosphaeria arxii CBS 175.79 TaxID=1450172 RepID=A0A6A5XR93_9PLEO|nr:uncharacterized protein BU24DRAFT_390728 [Aaosphaeria arxii CBS 175.79]KAF2015416.1 hypothetical protein BU24DRAFT_390728 [Aaosphaeria arxii CBS 175.79]